MKEQLRLLKLNMQNLSKLLEEFSVIVENEQLKDYQIRGYPIGDRPRIKLDYNDHRHYLVKQ